MILLVVEGTDREITLFENISSIFFAGKNKVITILAPADMNIYMLYTLLRKDEFETDALEVIRENSQKAREALKEYKRDDFSEIYYFFDFDEQGNNIPDKYKMKNEDALKEMLNIFNNETENGKLYISYPMVEAFRDRKEDSCLTKSGNCFRNRIDFAKYKNDSAPINDVHVSKYNFLIWKCIVNCFIKRICCLFQLESMSREEYINRISPISVNEKIMVPYKNKAEVFILSALPEFLLDYSANNWNSMIGKCLKHKTDKTCKVKISELFIK